MGLSNVMPVLFWVLWTLWFWHRGPRAALPTQQGSVLQMDGTRTTARQSAPGTFSCVCFTGRDMAPETGNGRHQQAVTCKERAGETGIPRTSWENLGR